MTEKLTLESPVVQEAKTAYEKSRLCHRHHVAFDTLFVGFSEGKTFRSIGTATGLKTHTVRYLWRRYFASWLRSVTRKARSNTDRVGRRERLERQIAALPKDSALRVVIDRALIEGCEVELVSYHEHRFLKTIARIEGRSVIVYEARTARKLTPRSERVYAEFHVTKDHIAGRDLIAFVSNVPGNIIYLYLLKTTDFIKAVFEGTTRRWWKLRVPLLRPNYPWTGKRRIDLSRYAGAHVTQLLRSLRESPRAV